MEMEDYLVMTKAEFEKILAKQKTHWRLYAIAHGFHLCSKAIESWRMLIQYEVESKVFWGWLNGAKRRHPRVKDEVR